MFKNLWTNLKSYGPKILDGVVLLAFVYWFFVSPLFWSSKTNPPLKEYKDGVQNHLVWSINGSCFFVRPNDDVTVYLIPVADCKREK
jgi:hypothetical protein